MAFGDKFNRSAPAKPAAQVGGKRRSKYGGVKAAEPRDPVPFPGIYRFRVVSVEEGHNRGRGTDSFKVSLEICQTLGDEVLDKPGDTVSAFWLTSGPAGPSGLSRVKSFVMAAAGYDDESEYDAFDPDGEFIDACAGQRNEYADAGLTIVGRYVDCEVTRGNPVVDRDTKEVKIGRDGKPDFYREFAWSPCTDDQSRLEIPAA